jgi:hypothetical protein
MGLGIAGIVVTVVSACRATIKAEEVLDTHRNKMEYIKDAVEYPDPEDEYTDADEKRDKLITYTQTAVGMVRLYAPTIAIGGLSVACILYSNKILKKRYLGAVAAYNAISASYEAYRRRVREKYGEDVDYEMRYGVTRETVEEKVVNENGKTVKKKVEVEHITCDASDYARYWGPYLRDGIPNNNYDRIREFNFMFLRGVEEEMNMLLHKRGYVFLNDVYDALGFEHTQLGQVIGWFDDDTGDGYIDFGLEKLNNRDPKRFIKGHEGEFLLDFNCDGIIWDKMSVMKDAS